MRTVLVTGSTRGLGLAFVRSHLGRGDRVLAAARAPGHSPALAELAVEFGELLVPIELDVSRESSVTQLAERLRGVVDRLDLVINNAGVSVEEEFGAWTTATFDDTFRVNATGPALVAQAVVPFMPEGSTLVNITSGMGSLELAPNPENGLDAYAMSRAAVNLLTRRLAAKVRPRGITVVALNPGWVRTDMGGAQAPTSIDEAITAMTATIDRLTPESSGGLLEADGQPLPW